MYIQNAVYKSVKPDPSLVPIAEGTVLNENGQLADASNAYGVVPQNVYHLAATGLISVAVAGTIDLTDKANAGVEFTTEMMDALHEFNFVPKVGTGLPSPAAADIGKVLTAVEGTEEVAVVPSQNVSFYSLSDTRAKAKLTGVDFSRLTDGDTVELHATMPTGDADMVGEFTGDRISGSLPEPFQNYRISVDGTEATILGISPMTVASLITAVYATATVSTGAKASWEEASGGGGGGAPTEFWQTYSASGGSSYENPITIYLDEQKTRAATKADIVNAFSGPGILLHGGAVSDVMLVRPSELFVEELYESAVFKANTIPGANEKWYGVYEA